MWISHRKGIRKLTFRALALRRSEYINGDGDTHLRFILFFCFMHTDDYSTQVRLATSSFKGLDMLQIN